MSGCLYAMINPEKLSGQFSIYFWRYYHAYNYKTKQNNTANVVFHSPDSFDTFCTLINDFLAKTGQYASTSYRELLVKVSGTDPCGGRVGQYGSGTDSDPYVYFKFASPSTTTRKATVVIDWGGINFNAGFSSQVVRFMTHDLAQNSTIHHINLDAKVINKTGAGCYVNGNGNVIFENCLIDCTSDSDNSLNAAVFHDGQGAIKFINTEVTGNDNSRTVINYGDGKVYATESEFKNSNQYFWGVYNESGTVFLDNCRSYGLLNYSEIYANNCRFNNEVYSEGEMHLSNSKIYAITEIADGRAYIDNCECYNREANRVRISAVQVENTATLMISNSFCVAFNTDGTSSTADAVGLNVVPNTDSQTTCRVNATNCIFAGYRNSSNSSAKAYGVYSSMVNGENTCYINLYNCRFIKYSSGFSAGTHDVDLFIGRQGRQHCCQTQGLLHRWMQLQRPERFDWRLTGNLGDCF